MEEEIPPQKNWVFANLWETHAHLKATSWQTEIELILFIPIHSLPVPLLSQLCDKHCISLLPKLYAFPKYFNSFFDCYWERGGEMEIKRHNRKDTDYSALFSVSFDPWILCFVLNFTPFFYYHYYSGSGKLLFVLATRNLSLSLSSTKRKRPFMVFAISFSYQTLNYSHFLHKAWLFPQGPLTLNLIYESSLVGL